MYFFLKAIPPRPSFVQDMNESEREAMQQHAGYWTTLTQRGSAIVFGPVLDPSGPYGIAVVDVENETELQPLMAEDPAAKAGVITLEVYPMMVGAVRS